VPDIAAWRKFVDAHVVATGWEEKVHFDHVLSNFGIDDPGLVSRTTLPPTPQPSPQAVSTLHAPTASR
jgi:hypothetical protein